MKYIIFLSSIIIWIFLSKTAYSWNHEVSLGYNHRTQEINHDYYNSGFFFNAKLYKFKNLDKTMILTIDSSIAQWRATTSDFNHLFTGGLSAAFRAYFITPQQRKFNPFLSASFGPAYISKTRLGECEQTKHITFQTTLGGGMEIILNKNQGITLSAQLIHYCNAGLYKYNRGMNMLRVISIGYVF
ncbi:MAG: acyloxyacyl hydrolase [Coxiellaceae bacterium]|nr:acyloxyacyl hydrolase [Coxiellaceae bacterium]